MADDAAGSVLEGRDARALFLAAGEAFATVAGALDPHALGTPATSEWTLRELVAHATRGLLTVATTLEAAVEQSARWLPSATAYFATALSAPGVHRGIVERARDAAGDVGDDPGGYARRALEAVRPLVDATPPGHVVQHRAGRLRFDEYLATRVVELALHTADVQLAVGGAVGFPPEPAALARDVVLGLVERADPLLVACVLTGRRTPAVALLG